MTISLDMIKKLKDNLKQEIEKKKTFITNKIKDDEKQQKYGYYNQEHINALNNMYGHTNILFDMLNELISENISQNSRGGYKRKTRKNKKKRKSYKARR